MESHNILSLAMLVVLVHSILIAKVLSDNEPQLKFGSIRLDSESTDFANKWELIKENDYYSSLRNNTFRVTCSASYPIMWSFEGFIVSKYFYLK